MMLDPRCVLVWLLKGAWAIGEKRGRKGRKKEKQEKKNGKRLKTWENEYNEIKWNDGSKIEFEKNYTKLKNVVEKN